MFEIKPKTRKEIYMAYLAGDLSLELPEPLTRDEVTLYNLCQSHAYGSTTTVKEVLAEQSIPLNGESYKVTEVGDIVVGETYVVCYRGAEYTCVAKEYNMDGTTTAVLGNEGGLSDKNTDSGEPFVYVKAPKDVAAMIGCSGFFLPAGSDDGDFPDSIVASIHEVSETIHPIDPKFLPSGGGGGSDLYAGIMLNADSGFEVMVLDGSEFDPETAMSYGKKIVVSLPDVIGNVISVHNTGNSAIDMAVYDPSNGGFVTLRYNLDTGEVYVPIG